MQRSSDEAADAATEVLAAVEGFGAAVNDYDTEAIPEYVTNDFRWQSFGPVVNLDEYLAYVDAHYERLGFHIEATGDPVIRVDGEEYVVGNRKCSQPPGLKASGPRHLGLSRLTAFGQSAKSGGSRKQRTRRGELVCGPPISAQVGMCHPPRPFDGLSG